jgi:hypothetical protein
MKLDTNLLQWAREIENYTLTEDRIEIIPQNHINLYQRMTNHLFNDNVPVLQVYTDDKYFAFVVRIEFQCKRRYDQCGIVVYMDSKNWLKASIGYENEEFHRLGSDVTNNGYLDWTSTNVDASIESMWFRLNRRENDFCIENSIDGVRYKKMHICHMFNVAKVIPLGLYACSVEGVSFKVVFSDIEISDCKWID